MTDKLTKTVTAALQATGCERLADFYRVGQVQRAAIESFADAVLKTVTPTPGTAALRRQVERLEAQLAALQQLLDRDRQSEYRIIMQNADMRMRIKQAAEILGAQE